jgi:hypothetical protein
MLRAVACDTLEGCEGARRSTKLGQPTQRLALSRAGRLGTFLLLLGAKPMTTHAALSSA